MALLLDSYERVGDVQKFAQTTDRFLQIAPNNLDALFAKAKTIRLLGITDREDMSADSEVVQRGLRVLGAASRKARI
jgi:hypothetical protein